MRRESTQSHLQLLILLQIIFLFLATNLKAEPFGFFGIRSSLKSDYLEDLGVGFIRGNLQFNRVYSISEDEWQFQKMDDKFADVYARNADLVVTFISPHNMEKIRADYYRDFILRSVERYDGDADYGCTQNPPDCYELGDNMYPTWGESERPAIEFWQMENEVDKDSYWLNHPEDYAELVNLVYPLVKYACTECTVLLGSLLGNDMNDSFYDVFFNNSDKFDIFDLHLFGKRNKDHFKRFSKRIDFLRERYPYIPIWITETSTYSDSPQKADGTYWPYQIERVQAMEVLKRYVHLASLGVEKILWNFLYEVTCGTENGVFWYTGLVYDGQGEFDKGKKVKKLAYLTYKLMVQKLDGADWQNIATIDIEDYVYQYRFMKDGTPVYVAWYDWFKGTVDRKKVTLDVSDISTAQVRVTKAVPRFSSGKAAETIPFEEAFTSYTVPVIDGTVDIFLGKSPVFIEEYETF